MHGDKSHIFHTNTILIVHFSKLRSCCQFHFDFMYKHFIIYNNKRRNNSINCVRILNEILF